MTSEHDWRECFWAGCEAWCDTGEQPPAGWMLFDMWLAPTPKDLVLGVALCPKHSIDLLAHMKRLPDTAAKCEVMRAAISYHRVIP